MFVCFVCVCVFVPIRCVCVSVTPVLRNMHRIISVRALCVFVNACVSARMVWVRVCCVSVLCVSVTPWSDSGANRIVAPLDPPVPSLTSYVPGRCARARVCVCVCVCARLCVCITHRWHARRGG